jgi:hypothetical protein
MAGRQAVSHDSYLMKGTASLGPYDDGLGVHRHEDLG